MMVVVEGRKPLCWNCKKLGHFSRSCPQKTTITGPKTTSTTADTINVTTTTTIATTDTATKNSNPETGVQPEKEEGWTLVKGNKKKSKKKKQLLLLLQQLQQQHQRQHRHQIKRKAKIINKKKWKKHLI